MLMKYRLIFAIYPGACVDVVQ